jgi:hypothetical protein
MAGDPFKDAVRARLATHRTTLGYTTTFPIKDTDDTATQPGVPSATELGFLELEFPGGPPGRQYTTGAPGANLHNETGQITIRVITPLRRNRDAAETVAAALSGKFLADRIPFITGHDIRIEGISPIGDGHDEGGNYVYSVLMAYQLYKVG